MQYECEDYYEVCENTGCCLTCVNAYDGCLCYECECKNCYWYSPGHCDKTDWLKEYRKKRFLANIEKSQMEKLEERKKKKKEDEEWHTNLMNSIVFKLKEGYKDGRII